MTSHIKRRGSTYYAQLAVPMELQTIVGRKTMEQSLRTKDPREARLLLPEVLKKWHRLFDDAKRGVTIAKESRQPSSNGQMAARLYKSDIALDEELRALDERYVRFEVDADEARRFRDGFSGKLSNAELANLIGHRIERFRMAGYRDYASNTPEWRAPAQDLFAARYEAMAREAERDDGDFAGRPAHPTIANAAPDPEQAPAAETIMDLFDRYARENAKGVNSDTLTQARRDVELFAYTIDR